MKFALRCGDDWVVWNFDGWSGPGWIALAATPVFAPGGRRTRPVYTLHWNGDHFRPSVDLTRMRQAYADETERLAVFFQIELARPE